MNSFIQQHKYHLSIFLILFIISLISGGYLLATNLTLKHENIKTLKQADSKSENVNLIRQSAEKDLSEKTLGEQKDSQNDNATLQHLDTSTLKSRWRIGIPTYSSGHLNTQTLTTSPTSPKLPISPSSTTSTTISSCQKNCLEAKIKIATTTYDLRLIIDATAYDAMSIVQQNSDFTFNGTDYSSLGFFVNEINGVKNDIKNNKFWIYYINGQSARVGISNYKLINKDIITWKYEESKF